MAPAIQDPDQHPVPVPDLALMTAAARPKPSEIRRRQVRMLCHAARLWFLLSQLWATSLALAYWPSLAEHPPSVWLAPTIWLSLLTLINLLGLALSRYHTAYQAAHQHPPHAVVRWHLGLRTLLALAGLGGGLGILWLQQDQQAEALTLSLTAVLLMATAVLLRHDRMASLQVGIALLAPAMLLTLLAQLQASLFSVPTASIRSLPFLTSSTAHPMSAFAWGLLGLGFLTVAWGASRQARLELIQQLSQRALVQYLDNARVLAENQNQALHQENARHQQTEAALDQARDELEQRVRERTRELAETNELLSQQIKLRKSISDALVKSQTRLSQAIEASHLALWDWDLNSGQVYQSHFHQAFGPREMSADEYLENLRHQVHPDDFARIDTATRAYLTGQSDRYLVQYRIRSAADQWLWVEDCGKAVRTGADGRIGRMLGTRRDITEEKQRDDQLRMAKAVFDSTSEGIFVLDTDFHFLSVNRAFSRITGYPESEVLGRALEDISQIPRKQEIFNQARATLAQGGAFNVELYEQRKNGDYYPVWLQLNLIRDVAGEATHYAGLFSDLTERKQVDDRLQFLLHYDDLTGLANRVLFRDRLHGALVQVRAGQSRYALLNLNIDRFKQINDSLGQDAGDELLRQIAQRLLALLPTADTLARLGGDEFCVLLQAASRTEAASLAERILTTLRLPFFVQDQEILIATSIGITMLPDCARDLQPALQQVNTAVRQAKYLGGNTFEFYSSGLRAVSLQRIKLETELRKALRTQALEVLYQPKLRLSSGQIDSVEALVRWHHPERGLVSPAEFVPIAEDSGLIVELGEQVLKTACQQAQDWHRQGLGPVRMAVNLSAHQLRQSGLAQQIQTVLRDTGLDPRLLDLELTESALMENVTRSLNLLGTLRGLGIQVSIDDFGTGYSSLSYLKRFPIDAIKIDQVFIKNLLDNPQDAAITQAIITLGRNLKLEVVAEGVESAAHQRFLQAQGCDLIQGYHVAPPLDAASLADLLQQQRGPRAS